MQYSFTGALAALAVASSHLQKMAVAINRALNISALLTEESWDRYSDALFALHDNLVLMENQLHLNYPFDAEKYTDIVNYTLLLQENEEPCSAKIEYLLDRPGFGLNNPYQVYEAAFLTELLAGITENSNLISDILGPVQLD